SKMFKCGLRQPLEFNREEAVLVERMIFERGRSHLRFAQVGLGESVRINDKDSIRLEIGDIRLKSGRGHGDKDVHRIAGCKNLVGREMQLVAADAGQGSGRGANFGREVWEGGDVVAIKRYSVRELAARDLHAIAGVSGKADYGAIDDLALSGFRQRYICSGGHPGMK